ncbi:MAG TPA: TonB family protein [Acidobacteriaceae bacterium]
MNIPTRLTTAQLRATLLRSRSTLISTLAHAVVLTLAFGVLHTSHIAPFKLPGTAHGLTMLTYYAAGSPPHAVSDIPEKAPVKQKADTSHAGLTLPMPKPKPLAAPATQDGTGNSSDDGLGEGDIKIAEQTYFPYPRPSLSSLPHGTSSDVILDAVIDEHGKISGLKLLKGLGQPIDEVVIATVRQWSFAPATRNGVPIPSEQELHFHYERS